MSKGRIYLNTLIGEKEKGKAEEHKEWSRINTYHLYSLKKYHLKK